MSETGTITTALTTESVSFRDHPCQNGLKTGPALDGDGGA